MFFKKIRNNEFFKGSMILLFLINIGNVLNYLYQIIMARMLGPGDYGILAVLISLTYIFAIPTIAIQTGIAKKTSRLNLDREYGKMKGLFLYFIKRLFFVSIILFVLFSALSIMLAKPLGIKLGLLILTGTLIITSFIYPLASGFLQGMKKFSLLGWNTILIFSTKLLIAIILVLLGLRVYGAIFGFILGMIIGFVLAMPFLRKVLNAKPIKNTSKLFSKENILIFIAMSFLVFIYSLDVILAKIFFSGSIVGQYAVISMVGKIILFSTMSIGNVMFPISSERHHAGIKTQSLMKKASLLVFAICLLSILIFSKFAEPIIKFLFGSGYIQFASLLFPITIAFSCISFFNLLLLYRISRDELKIYHLGIIALLLLVQVVLLFIFHIDMNQFVKTFMFSSIITFIGGIFFVRKWKK